MTTTNLAGGLVVPGWGRLGGCAGKRVEARGRETENCGAKKIKSTAVTTVTKVHVFPEHIYHDFTAWGFGWVTLCMFRIGTCAFVELAFGGHMSALNGCRENGCPWDADASIAGGSELCRGVGLRDGVPRLIGQMTTRTNNDEFVQQGFVQRVASLPAQHVVRRYA